MKKGLNITLMLVGVTTIIVSLFLGGVFTPMYFGILVGLATLWGALPDNSAKKAMEKEEKALNLSFDGTTTQTGMSM